MICVNCGKEINYNDLTEKGIAYDKNAKVCSYCVTNYCSRKKIIYKDFNDRLVIDDKVFNDNRTIVTLLNNKVKLPKCKKTFREIVGLDVLSGGIVKIIDENGKGLHTDSEYIGKLDVIHVTKATFKYMDNADCINTWRITSGYEEPKETDLYKLCEKYKRTYFFDVCVNFEDVIDFANESDKSFYCLVKFTGSEIKYDQNKRLCLKMGKQKVFIDKNFKKPTVTDGTMFRGIALLYVLKNGSRSKFFAKYLYDDGKKIKFMSETLVDRRIQRKTSKIKEKFEEVQFVDKEYISAIESSQNNLTKEEILTIQNDIKPSVNIMSKRFEKQTLSNLLGERIWTI